MQSVDLTKILAEEATRAEADIEEAKTALLEVLAQPEAVTPDHMEAMAYAQAYCSEIMVFWIVAKKYERSREAQLVKLQEKHRSLVEALSEDHGASSTSLWANAADRTRRKARINVMHKLRGILG